MNHKVRAYLIEAARQQDKFVYYSDVVKDCQLGFDLSNEYGKRQLSIALGEVSEFENNHHRPLVSAMAIYKDAKMNDHGDGFYKLAQSLGKGKIKQLREDLYAFEQAEESRKFWQNDKNYAQFFNLEPAPSPAAEPEFFTLEDINFFRKWQYQAYDKNNPAHVDAKNRLMDTVWKKSIYLGNQIVKRLAEFKSDGKRYWSQRGWAETDGINVQAARFKPYTWIKIYRNTDKGKDIFFTFGVDVHPHTDTFVYKIDCQRTRDSKLNDKQIQLANELIPESAKWNTISYEKLLAGNWKSLVNTCIDFIRDNLEIYDATVKAIWGAAIPPQLFKNKLVFRDKPKDGASDIPMKPKTFEGVDINFLQQAADQKDLGNCGEGLVKQYEVAQLSQIGRQDLAAMVNIVKDGMGYDILSFDEAGNEKYIEVKTTGGNRYSPFYLSENEIEFARFRKGQYCIYRIYNYDQENNFGEFYKIFDDVESQLLYKPVSFQVYLKKENE